MDIKDIARACHEVNRTYCLALGDSSQPPWEEAPDWQKKATITRVKSLLQNPTATPGQSHSSMVPYSILPASQRAKDSIFQAVVRGLAEV